MARTNKNLEVKTKQEIVKIALHLFFEKGYENTTINNILQVANISKGGIYHYFNSKEEILDAAINYVIDQDYGRLEAIIHAVDISAVQKLNALFSSNEKPSDVTEASDYVQRNKNSLFDYRSKELSLQRTVPDIAKIMRQGVNEGIFHTDFPDEMAEFYYVLARSLFDSPTIFSEQRKRIEAFICLSEKSLGTSSGELDIIKNTLLSQFQHSL